MPAHKLFHTVEPEVTAHAEALIAAGTLGMELKVEIRFCFSEITAGRLAGVLESRMPSDLRDTIHNEFVLARRAEEILRQRVLWPASRSRNNSYVKQRNDPDHLLCYGTIAAKDVDKYRRGVEASEVLALFGIRLVVRLSDPQPL